MEIKKLCLRMTAIFCLAFCLALTMPSFGFAEEGTTSCYTPTITYACTISDLNGLSTPPCPCPKQELSPKFCPRLEGIQMPCLQRFASKTCVYSGQEVCVFIPTPSPTPTQPSCTKTKYCNSTNQVCTAYAQTTCTRTVNTSVCVAYSESGACAQSTTSSSTESYACTGACTNFETVNQTVACGCDD